MGINVYPFIWLVSFVTFYHKGKENALLLFWGGQRASRLLLLACLPFVPFPAARP